MNFEKTSVVTTKKIFAGIGAATALLALAVILDKHIIDPVSRFEGTIYALTFVVIFAFLVGYLLLIHLRKLHRYSETVYDIHRIAHDSRDLICQFSRLDPRDPDENRITHIAIESKIQSIVDAVADCFTPLIGVHASVCIKTWKDEDRDLMMIFMRDSRSKGQRSQNDDLLGGYDLESDTPCMSIAKGNRSYYLCNDVWKQYLSNDSYKSPRFYLNGGNWPEVSKNLFGHKVIEKWPLGYKSCMTVPIRSPKLEYPESNSSPTVKKHNYWGFLCIDTRRTNLFDEERHTELAKAFADMIQAVLYTLKTTPNSKTENDHGEQSR